jgi:crotonobetainyl-CoA:carnitine CoA-transferase CaiB-like acyl-CoA transferase
MPAPKRWSPATRRTGTSAVRSRPPACAKACGTRCTNGSKFADHARGNRELQAILRDIFKTKSSQEWLEFSIRVNTPIAPVNTPKNIVDDPQFQDRFEIWPHERHGADMLGFPVRFVGEPVARPAKAPTVGEHADEVLRDVLGYDAAKIAAIKADKLLG